MFILTFFLNILSVLGMFSRFVLMRTSCHKLDYTSLKHKILSPVFLNFLLDDLFHIMFHIHYISLFRD